MPHKMRFSWVTDLNCPESPGFLLAESSRTLLLAVDAPSTAISESMKDAFMFPDVFVICTWPERPGVFGFMRTRKDGSRMDAVPFPTVLTHFERRGEAQLLLDAQYCAAASAAGRWSSWEEWFTARGGTPLRPTDINTSWGGLPCRATS